MRENEAPELVPKPESTPPEVLHLRDYSSRHFPGPGSSTYYDGPTDSIRRPDYATLSSASQSGTRYAQDNERVKRICGIRRATFIFSTGLAFVVVGAVVGGAVGGHLANQKSSECPSATGSPTSQYFNIPTSGVSVALDCPKINGQPRSSIIAKTSRTFTLECGIDYPDSSQDLLGITSYTMDDCIHACAAYNQATNSTECVMAVFIADVSDATSRYTGNCWIKNGTKNKQGAPSERYIAAQLDI